MSFANDNRGRITIVEVLLGVFAMGFLGALWPVVADSLDSATQYMNAGEIYLFRLLLPLMLLVFLTVILVTANQGGA